MAERFQEVPGGPQEAPRKPRRPPGSPREAPRRPPGGLQGGSGKVSKEVPRRPRGPGDLNNEPQRPRGPQIPRRLEK